MKRDLKRLIVLLVINLMLLVALLTLMVRASAQCPTSTVCSGSNVEWSYSVKIDTDSIRYKVPGSGLWLTIKPDSITQQTIHFQKPAAFDCADTLSNIKYYLNGSKVGSCSDPFPVPVELMYFRAMRDGGSVTLEWATASEYNADRFEIWAHSKGIVYSVAAQGNTNQVTEYSHTVKADKSPQFYQIVQYDFDGTAHRSRMVFVREESSIDRTLRRYNVIGQMLW